MKILLDDSHVRICCLAGPCIPYLCFFFKEKMISYLYTYGSILLKPKVKSPAGKGLTSWLFIVFLLLSHVVSWVRCGS